MISRQNIGRVGAFAVAVWMMSAGWAIVGRKSPEIRFAPTVTISEPVQPERSLAPAGKTVSERAAEAFQSTTQKPFTLVWNEDRSRVVAMGGGRSRVYSGTPEQKARSFAAHAQAILGSVQVSPQMIALPERDTPLGPQVILQQTVNGLPVLDKQVVVTMNRAGEVVLVENTTTDLPEIDTRAEVSPLQAILNLPGTLVKAPELAIDASGTEPRLVWEFVYSPAFDKVLRTRVDARTGETVSRLNLVKHVTGTGKVYLGNPKSSPTQVWRDIKWLDGSGYLTGLYAKSHRYTGSSGTGFTGAQDVYQPSPFVYDYAGTDTKLPQLQAYYAANTIHDFFKDTFGMTLRDNQLPMYVSVPDYPNAFYTPTGTYGAMVAGKYGSIDLALDTDVLAHEYTHSVVDVVAPSLSANYNAEPGGMNEGFADYFSCTTVGDPKVGEYSGQLFGLPAIRDISNRNHYPEEILMWQTSGSIQYQDFHEVHQIGDVWGPACWDLYTALGKTKADRLLYTALGTLTGTSTFQSALVAILAADTSIYSGANADRIRMVFNNRGIYETASPIQYLNGNSFYSGTSKIRTGYIYKDSSGYFWPEYSDSWVPMGLHCGFGVGRKYAIVGFTEDNTINSVFVVVKNSSGTTIHRQGANTFALNAKVGGVTKAYKEISFLFSLPTSLIPTGETKVTGLKFFLASFTQKAADVTASTTAKATVGNHTTEIFIPQTTPVVAPPPFGDVDANGKTQVADAVLVLRAASGLQTLTTAQKTQADLASPVDGNPNAADAIILLKTAAGLM